MEHETLEVKASVTSGNQVQVLIAEDDMPLANFLKRGLESDKYAVDLVHDGQSALEALGNAPYGLLILDLNLPVMDGMTLLKQIRPTMPALPVLVLTGRSELQDRVQALDGGADDCLVKPFSFHELTARARALLRRHGKSSRGVVRVGDLVLDRSEFRVERAGKKIDLTAKEFALLEYLMLNTRTAVNRAMIMENVWKAPYDAKTNLVDVYVKYVRDKIDAAHCSKLIRTVRGVGYVLAEN
jgi:DNA-binding response OmpR family regulator